mgnify:CR=1 FL=1
MANPQLIAYVKAQLEKGVAHDAIKQALIGAGWAPNEVEAATTEVFGQTAAAPVDAVQATSVQPAVTTQPAAAQVQPAATAQVTANPIAEPVGETSSPVVGSAAAAINTTSAQPAAQVTPASFFSTTGAGGGTEASVGSEVSVEKKSHGWLIGLLVGIVALAAIGAAAYFFIFSGAGSTQPADNGELQALQQQKTELEGQITTLNDDVNDLQAHLAIFQDSDAETASLTMTGTLRERPEGGFTLTTKRAITLLLLGTTTADASAALRPFIGAEVKIGGTHTPGSTSVTVTNINDQSFDEFVAAANVVAETPPATEEGDPVPAQ